MSDAPTSGPVHSRHHEQSVLVDATPEAVYDLVSDVTRTGEWSPVCEACWWEDAASAGQVGAWFAGRNVTPTRTWETRSQVAVATPGSAFAWVVGGVWVGWAFRMEPEGTGTRLTEVWEFLPAGHDRFVELYGDDALDQIEDRTRAAYDGIPATLAAIRRILES